MPFAVTVTPWPGTCHAMPFSRRELTALLMAMAAVLLPQETMADGITAYNERANTGAFTAMEDQKPPQLAVELLLLPDVEMARLNTQAMGVQGPTNVLSFPSNMAESNSPDICQGLPNSLLHTRQVPPAAGVQTPLLGSLALGVETLRREAFLYGQLLDRHCIRLLAHGMAHLAGFDHGPEMDECTDALEEAGEAFAA